MALSFRELMQKRVVIFDGAMGTSIQNFNLSAYDFGGGEYDGCNEYLNLMKPDVIEKIHAGFFEVGCDAVETNTFGATSLVLGEYGLAAQTYNINRTAAALAKKVANSFASPDSPRFVAGSMGPGTRLLSLGQISFDEMHAMYLLQAKGLIDGGVDLFIIETCQDILQAKAALTAVLQAKAEKKCDLPVMVQVTIEKDLGTMLVGTDISAAVTALEPYPIDVIGINCATGPEDMRQHVHYLSNYSSKMISVLPNAGIPENVDGHPVYKLQPDELARAHLEFVGKDHVNIIGGCCGTTFDHLEAVVKTVKGKSAAGRKIIFEPSVSSLYQSVALNQNPKPLIVGERANANGSKKFRELLLANEYERTVQIGKSQEKDGAHVLDVCTAYVDRDEKKDMYEVISRFNRQVSLPLMIDSTETDVLETALKLIGGRVIINSVNLEDGEKRLEKVLTLCKKYGAAVIALTIDEEGMALTTDKKVAIAHRIHNLVVNKYGLRSQDLILDPLTFTLANPEYAGAGVNTIEAVRKIKQELPDCYTLLGVSNCSFGMNLYPRKILNSVFLYQAVKAGLDLAIVNYRHILPLNQISDTERELAGKVVLNQKINGEPALNKFMYLVGSKKVKKQKRDETNLSLPEILKNKIIDGDEENLHAYLDRTLQEYQALEIVNTILLDGMKTVGNLFGSGRMQLPFVLKSAEVMKAAVKYLEPHMDKAAGSEKGRIVLATVKGDVHDIGKNLVDIILTNNGYEVINLGIKVPIHDILKAADTHRADAIGMSGLLVKSTVVMKENLEEMNHSGHYRIPVILGGAALTKKFVNGTLRQTFRGDVYYATDAFSGLNIMEGLVHPDEEKEHTSSVPAARKPARKKKDSPENLPLRSRISRIVGIPAIPFFGTRIVENISLTDVFPFINKRALFRGQWQYRQRKLSDEAFAKLERETIEPVFLKLKRQCLENNRLLPKVVYGYFHCNSQGDNLIIYQDDAKTERLRFHFPRQKKSPYLCLADFFADVDSGKTDVIAMHLVTIGSRAGEAARQLYAENKYSDYLYLHGISVETAEALAEYWHKMIRREMNIHHEDAADIKDLFHQKYRGSRYSFGYPACPNLADQVKLFQLLQPERIGVKLTEEYMIEPEQSTSAIIVHHPEAKYFNV